MPRPEQWDPYARSCIRYRVVIYDDPAYYPYRYEEDKREYRWGHSALPLDMSSGTRSREWNTSRVCASVRATNGGGAQAITGVPA